MNEKCEQVFPRELKASFCLREPKGVNPSIIYMVVRVNDKQIKLSTGVKVYPNHWDRRKQEAWISVRLTEQDNRNNEIVNNRLSLLKGYFLDFKMYLCTNPNEIRNSTQLVREFIYKDMAKNKKTNIDAIERLRKEVYEDNNIKDSSREVYIRCLKLFEEFATATQRLPLSFENINCALLKDFEKWLFITPDRKGQNRKTETVGKTLTNIKAIVKRVEHYGLIDETTLTQIANYQVPRGKDSEDNEIYLTEEEINNIYSLPLKGKQAEIRDVFVLQCWTGQRFSDISELCKGVVKELANGRIIEIVQEKTGERVSIPLFPIVEEILNKYECRLPIHSDITVNKELKEIGKLAGIDRKHIRSDDRGIKGVTTEVHEAYKLIGTHTARRSYISNMLKRGYDSHIIMKITGHRTDDAFKRYTRLTSEDAANTVLEQDSLKRENAVGRTTAQRGTAVTVNKPSMLEYCLGAKTILNLIDLREQGIDIYQLPEMSRVIAIVKDMRRLDEVKERFIDKFNKSDRKTEILEEIERIDRFIWEIGKYKADTVLYQMLQHKLLILGLSSVPIIPTEDLHYIWQQELREDEDNLL